MAASVRLLARQMRSAGVHDVRDLGAAVGAFADPADGVRDGSILATYVVLWMSAPSRIHALSWSRSRCIPEVWPAVVIHASVLVVGVIVVCRTTLPMAAKNASRNQVRLICRGLAIGQIHYARTRR
jgi:hydrogenase/urease accessory protein HupE